MVCEIEAAESARVMEMDWVPVGVPEFWGAGMEVLHPMTTATMQKTTNGINRLRER